MNNATDNLEVAKNDKGKKDEIKSLLDEIPVLKELFDIHYKVGEGTFSSVYLATMKSNYDSKKFAIKHIIPTYPPARIERELKCLQEIGGADNVVGVELCIRNGPSVAFVMPFMRHNKFSDYVGDMNQNELKHYMRALLIALRKVHLFNIIHRDVKPSNFLYDRRHKKYLLVDFGLAQNYVEETQSNNNGNLTEQFESLSMKRKRGDENNRQSQVALKKSMVESKCYCFGKPKVCSVCLMKPSQVASRAGTPGYRPPEVLLKYSHQTPAIDVWAAGIIMLCILSATQPFFRCPDDSTALAEMITVFGTNKMQQCARKLGKKLICSENISGIDLVTLCQKLRQRSFNSQQNNTFYNRKNTLAENYPPEAYDLLSRLLDVDYKTRITANDALEHPFLKV
ncbi:cell division cycle 7-related protein kinase [Microplitis demolitor]|uniref:cell division cycle 7-related protein kinase n=1 Tax=Microplitis demolitor TaxID=69319 RepID=UPI0004CCBDE2|nr:cell division cycle 7-related protein kinase [Microplitis demolitor]